MSVKSGQDHMTSFGNWAPLKLIILIQMITCKMLPETEKL
ncbi:MAG: hypothetical protein RLZ75_2718 [Pseudomonadota bacterium]